jgi:hypothetical protein
MNKIKLPSSIEYGKKVRAKLLLGETEYKYYFKKRDYFDAILSQQPNIGMVVAAVFENGEWRVLSKPIFDFNNEYDGEKRREFAIALKEFETALDNVIFDGFEYDGSEEGFIYVKNGETLLIFDTENKTLFLYNSENNYTTEIKTIEYLTPYNLTLTSKFAKELGLI